MNNKGQFNNEHHITPEELFQQLEKAGLTEIAAALKDGKTSHYSFAQDTITDKTRSMSEYKFPETTFSKEELDKYHNMSEEIIAEILLRQQKSPLQNKITELRENFNPTTSDNDNKPTNK